MLWDALPADLRTRARRLTDGAPSTGDGFVLYWMRIAARDHENPALDAAIHAANALGGSVLVYHGLSERYPFASDRHHTFILEGARDVARGLRARGIPYALYVERPGARGPMLRTLAERATLVVTEEAPMPPLAAWTARLAEHLAGRVPMWAVDASCVVPMRSGTARPERAFAFRAETRATRDASLARGWEDAVLRAASPVPPLPFEPIDATSLDARAIARLVAACAIDHAVGPVRAVRGGSEAGYARWRAFRDAHLGRYAATRNDPTHDGTSRLSPYLHYGHVSPFRIAREAAERGPAAEKFLDELLVWRELAWHFAAHTPELESLDVLPAWARATLAAHAADPRPRMPMEALERGRTGDALWDLAQRALITTGELHNNLRMTWGKAMVGWTPDAEAARHALVALNHRYALDGRDPASYGGLYWCLGLFDRPFTPESPVLGSIRPRPTEEHARRLDLDAYARVIRARARSLGRVAVVGAGVAGLACARTLHDHGVDVVVFDKGRAPGGRLATRRVGRFAFDLGAQYFTARDPRFRRWLASWRDAGLVQAWPGRIGSVRRAGEAIAETPALERFVGAPDMPALARHLAADLVVHSSHRVDALAPARQGASLMLRGVIGAAGTTLGPAGRDEGALADFGAFDAVVVALPPSQARALVGGVSASLDADLADVAFDPCIALGIGFAEAPALTELPFDGVFVGRDEEDDRRTVSWFARNASKPGRSAGEAWVVHAGAAWSRAHLRDADAVLVAALLEELDRVTGAPVGPPEATTIQRWALARPRASLAHGALFDEAARVAVGGDWALGGRVEGAFLSGLALAVRVLGLDVDRSA